MSVQINVRTSEDLVKELDEEVKSGLYKNRTEAINEAIMLLVRRDRMRKIEERMRRISKKLEGKPSVSRALMESREEADEL